jgi:hypothetical protein
MPRPPPSLPVLSIVILILDIIWSLVLSAWCLPHRSDTAIPIEQSDVSVCRGAACCAPCSCPFAPSILSVMANGEKPSPYAVGVRSPFCQRERSRPHTFSPIHCEETRLLRDDVAISDISIAQKETTPHLNPLPQGARKLLYPSLP